jgi:hypothetical protein
MDGQLRTDDARDDASRHHPGDGAGTECGFGSIGRREAVLLREGTRRAEEHHADAVGPELPQYHGRRDDRRADRAQRRADDESVAPSDAPHGHRRRDGRECRPQDESRDGNGCERHLVMW